MARCCGGATCACKMEAGRHVRITGTGTAQDPFVISAQTHLTVEDSTAFRLVLNGNGTLDSPWSLTVLHAAGAGLDTLPNVNTEGKTNGQTLIWDESQEEWVAASAPTASPGVIITGDGVDGDGSAGDPLVAVGDLARYIEVTASGIGLSDAGINQLVRVFADEFSRDNADPAPVEGTVAIVETDPTTLWMHDGVEWQTAIQGVGRDIEGELLATSGSYSGGPVTRFVRQISVNTDGTGAFVAVSAEDLLEYSGVISCDIRPTGTGTPWQPMLTTGGGAVTARARRMSDGAAHAGATITATVDALLY